MFEELRARLSSVSHRVRRIERRELGEFQSWIENTGNLLHLSVLFFVPLLIGTVTWLSGATAIISFLVYPPLASGTYTLFADPEGKYSYPLKFVGGITTGALCGWVALEFTTRFVYAVPTGEVGLHAGSAALSVFLTAIGTWTFDLEEPTAFSTALLVLISGSHQFLYVINVAISSIIIAIAYTGWHRYFYTQRARYIYQSTKNSDHVLVPLRADSDPSTAIFAAKVAAAHEAGKVVLLRTVSSKEMEATEDAVRSQQFVATDDEDVLSSLADEHIEQQTLEELDSVKQEINQVVDVPCEAVVAVEGRSRAQTILDAAREATCDLVVHPYATDDGRLTKTIRTLFNDEINVIVYRSTGSLREWTRILALVRKPGDIAHMILDFSQRIVPDIGSITVCNCTADAIPLRSAEEMLRNLVETFAQPFDIHVAHTSVEEFLDQHSRRYDLVVIGASSTRSPASRFLSPPTFERIEECDCDLAIVHRGRP